MGSRVDCLEPAPAQPIDGQTADLHRQSSQEQRHARHVAVVLTGLVGATEDDVLDEGRIDPGPVDYRTHDERG